jgi:hypothetical protein
MRGGISPSILKFVTSWMWVISFRTRPLHLQGKSTQYPLELRLGETHSRSGCGGDEKISRQSHCRKSNSGCLARSIVSVLTYLDSKPGIKQLVSNLRFLFLNGSQSSAELRLVNGLLPVIFILKIDLTVPRPQLRFPDCWLFPGWGHEPHAQPSTWRTRSIYIPWWLGGPVVPSGIEYTF